MNRETALRLMTEYLGNRNLQKHCLATEAVMRGLADHFGENAEIWGIAGLLHDLDYEETKDDPARHGLVSAGILSELGVPGDIIYAVKAHNGAHGLERHSLLDKALYATDPFTGLAVAAALILPGKKLHGVDVGFLVNRFYEKSFARGANREQIAACSDLKMSLEEFFAVGLESMQQISDDLGL